MIYYTEKQFKHVQKTIEPWPSHSSRLSRRSKNLKTSETNSCKYSNFYLSPWTNHNSKWKSVKIWLDRAPSLIQPGLIVFFQSRRIKAKYIPFTADDYLSLNSRNQGAPIRLEFNRKDRVLFRDRRVKAELTMSAIYISLLDPTPPIVGHH